MKTVTTLLFFLVAWLAQAAPTYTEFYVDANTASTTSTNINAGSTTGAPAYATVSGNWDGTNVFTPTDGSTPASTVSAGDWCSVYTNSDTRTYYHAKVASVAAGANGAITLSTAAFSGTVPTSNNGSRSLIAGGAWAGPVAGVGFPFGFIGARATNASGQIPRVNFKSGTTHAVTAAMTHGVAGPVRFEGYTSSIGDGGRVTFDGGAGSGYTLLSISGLGVDFENFIIQNNGASSTGHGLVLSGNHFVIRNCVFHNIRESGVRISGLGTVSKCEAYLCDLASTFNEGGFAVISSGIAAFNNCISHDNTNSQAIGFASASSGSMTLVGCIADSNGRWGAFYGGAGLVVAINSDFYNNGVITSSAGLDIGSGTGAAAFILNCNFLKNVGNGIGSSSVPTLRNGSIINCGFGTGTQTNTTGGIVSTMLGVNIIGMLEYASNTTPWTDPANGDFRINLAAAKSTGYGAFTQTQASYSGTASYPDIGAGQATNSSGTVSFTFGQ